MRKKRGTILIALGLLLLLGAAGLTLYNIHVEAQAGESANEISGELATVLADVEQKPPVKSAPPDYLEETEEQTIELDGRYYLGLITFPTINLQLPVQHEWSYENLRISPCRMTGDILSENLVVLAHNYRTHFGPLLNNVGVGDEVSLMLVDGSVYVYKVAAKEVVAPTAVENVTGGDWPLTLFTCTLGGRTRMVLRCDWAE